MNAVPGCGTPVIWRRRVSRWPGRGAFSGRVRSAMSLPAEWPSAWRAALKRARFWPSMSRAGMRVLCALCWHGSFTCCCKATAAGYSAVPSPTPSAKTISSHSCKRHFLRPARPRPGRDALREIVNQKRRRAFGGLTCVQHGADLLIRCHQCRVGAECALDRAVEQARAHGQIMPPHQSEELLRLLEDHRMQADFLHRQRGKGWIGAEIPNLQRSFLVVSLPAGQLAQ